MPAPTFNDNDPEVKPLIRALALLAAVTPLLGQPGRALPYRDARLPIPARVRYLLGRMTGGEKLWQLYMAPGDLDDPHEPFEHSVFGLQIRIADTTRQAARRHAEQVNRVQRHFVDRTRLGVPIIPFEEALPGALPMGKHRCPRDQTCGDSHSAAPGTGAS